MFSRKAISAMRNSGRFAAFVLLAAAVAVLPAVLGIAGERVHAAGPDVKIGLLSSHEYYLPFTIAQQKGYFAAEGVSVEVIPFQSARERDAALQAGQIDGVMTDIIGSVLLKSGGVDVSIVALVWGVTPQEEIFSILASPKSNIKTVEDLKGVPIAISSGTIIEYVTDTLLTRAGFSDSEIKKVVVAQIPVRMEMLLNGQVQAATMPHMLGEIARLKGARVIVDDSVDNISQTVMTMNASAVKTKAEAIKKMMRAYDRAVKDLAANPEAYRKLFVETCKVPPELAATYPVPNLPTLHVLPAEFYNRVVDWMVKRELVKSPISYKDMVNTSLVSSK